MPFNKKFGFGASDPLKRKQEFDSSQFEGPVVDHLNDKRTGNFDDLIEDDGMSMLESVKRRSDIEADLDMDRRYKEREDSRRAANLKALMEVDRELYSQLRAEGRLDTMDDLELSFLVREARFNEERQQRELDDRYERRMRAGEAHVEDLHGVNESYNDMHRLWKRVVDLAETLEGEPIGPVYKFWKKIKLIGVIPTDGKGNLDFRSNMDGIEMKNADEARAWFVKQGAHKKLDLLDEYEEKLKEYQERLQSYSAEGLQREGLAQGQRENRKLAEGARVSRPKEGTADPFEGMNDAFEDARGQFEAILDRRLEELDLSLSKDQKRILMKDDWLVVNVGTRHLDFMSAVEKAYGNYESFLFDNGVTTDVQGRPNQRQLDKAFSSNFDPALDHAAEVLPVLGLLVQKRIDKQLSQYSAPDISSDNSDPLSINEAGVVSETHAEDEVSSELDTPMVSDVDQIDDEYIDDIIDSSQEVVPTTYVADMFKNMPFDEDYKRVLLNDPRLEELAKQYNGDMLLAADTYRHDIVDDLKALYGLDVSSDFKLKIPLKYHGSIDVYVGMNRDGAGTLPPVATAEDRMRMPLLFDENAEDMIKFLVGLMNAASDLVVQLKVPAVPAGRMKARFDDRKEGGGSAVKKGGLLDRVPENPNDTPADMEVAEQEDGVSRAIDTIDAYAEISDLGEDSLTLYDARFIDRLVEAGGDMYEAAKLEILNMLPRIQELQDEYVDIMTDLSELKGKGATFKDVSKWRREFFAKDALFTIDDQPIRLIDGRRLRPIRRDIWERKNKNGELDDLQERKKEILRFEEDVSYYRVMVLLRKELMNDRTI